MTEKISPTMRAAIIYAKKFNDKITRHQGGFWARKGWTGPRQEHSFGTSTIQALVSRSLAEYTKWQDGKMRFPTEITLTSNGKEVE